MLENINIWLWLSLVPSYFFYEYVGTKNIIATNRLRAGEASNTGAAMYVIGIVGTYFCVTEGLINIVPIIIGSWLGTYFSVKGEIKIQRRNKQNKNNVRHSKKQSLVESKIPV